MFLEDLGLKGGCNRLIKTIYSLLNLETFITTGEMGSKGMDLSQMESTAMRRRYPYRISKRVYPGRGHQV